MRRRVALARPGERGLVAGAEAIMFGTLIVVAGTVAIAATWGVIDMRWSLDDAARAYLRAYTEASDPDTAARSGQLAMIRSLEGSGVDPSSVQVEAPDPDRFGPCAPVELTLRSSRAGVRLPFVSDLGAVTMSVHHEELVDAHREMQLGSSYDVLETPCGG